MISVLVIFEPLLIGPLNENGIQKVIILNHLLYVLKTIATIFERNKLSPCYSITKEIFFFLFKNSTCMILFHDVTQYVLAKIYS